MKVTSCTDSPDFFRSRLILNQGDFFLSSDKLLAFNAAHSEGYSISLAMTTILLLVIGMSAGTMTFVGDLSAGTMTFAGDLSDDAMIFVSMFFKLFISVPLYWIGVVNNMYIISDNNLIIKYIIS